MANIQLNENFIVEMKYRLNYKQILAEIWVWL